MTAEDGVAHFVETAVRYGFRLGTAEENAGVGIAIVPPDADPGAVAEAVVAVVDAPIGERPFRVHVDPS
jgi:hypothetical protein